MFMLGGLTFVVLVAGILIERSESVANSADGVWVVTDERDQGIRADTNDNSWVMPC